MTPDDELTTQQLRDIFAERADAESEQAEVAEEDEGVRAHARRAEKAAYLKEKLEEKADSEAVAVTTEPGKEALTRAVAEAGYRHGARFVDVFSYDLHVKRARVVYGRDEDLEYVPPWYGQRILALGEQRAARVALTGPVEPHLFDGLDPARLARATRCRGCPRP